MTVVAGIATRNMRWMFTGRDHAIVTGAADTDYLRVVNGKHGHEHIGVMAVFAHVARLNMRRALAGGVRAVMAVNAITGNIQVIEIRR